MKKFEYQIEKVTGHCSCGYKVGDVFQCDGMNTPVLHFVEVLTWLCFLFKSPYTMELPLILKKTQSQKEIWLVLIMDMLFSKLL